MAVTWKRIAYQDELHTQNTDTGTSSNDFAVGDGVDTDKTLTIQNADATKPKLKYNATTSKWEYSNDGVAFNNFSTAVVADTEVAKFRIAAGATITVNDYEQIFLAQMYIIEGTLNLLGTGMLVIL